MTKKSVETSVTLPEIAMCSPKKLSGSLFSDAIGVTSFGTIKADLTPGLNNIEVTMHPWRVKQSSVTIKILRIRIIISESERPSAGARYREHRVATGLSFRVKRVMSTHSGVAGCPAASCWAC